MSKVDHPFVFKCSEEEGEEEDGEYLGSDSLPIEETYNIYLKKCQEFRANARKYAKDNLCLKNSYLHHTKLGYERSEELEEEVLLERKEHMEQYKKAFSIFFDEDPNAMFECFEGKSKKIRIIRELDEERSEEFSDDFEQKKSSWFKRYCILSRFIQAARKIILLNRLKKVLAILKAQIPKMIAEAEESQLKETYSKTKTSTEYKKISGCKCNCN